MPNPNDGEILVLDGNDPNRNNMVIAGYESGDANYALSNFERPTITDPLTKIVSDKGYTFNDPDMQKHPYNGKIWFPTSEHFLHFQKLTPTAKEQCYEDWKKKSPGDVLALFRRDQQTNLCAILVNDQVYMTTKSKLNGQFNDDLWNQEQIGVQFQICAAKYRESAAFRAVIDSAIANGFRLDGGGALGIMEDTSTARFTEERWGTGRNGAGTNILGNTQTAFANLLRQNPGLKAQILDKAQPLPIIDFKFGDKNNAAYNEYKIAEAQFEQIRPQLKAVRASAPVDTSDSHKTKYTATTQLTSVKKLPGNWHAPQPQPQPLQATITVKETANAGEEVSIKPARIHAAKFLDTYNKSKPAREHLTIVDPSQNDNPAKFKVRAETPEALHVGLQEMLLNLSSQPENQGKDCIAQDSSGNVIYRYQNGKQLPHDSQVQFSRQSSSTNAAAHNAQNVKQGLQDIKQQASTEQAASDHNPKVEEQEPESASDQNSNSPNP